LSFASVERRDENLGTPMTWRVARKRGQRKAIAAIQLGKVKHRDLAISGSSLSSHSRIDDVRGPSSQSAAVEHVYVASLKS
jgi:hypothetical protein